MPGSIIKRGKGSWTVIVDVGRDPVTGKRRQLWRSMRGPKRDAEALLVRLMHERDTGIDVQPGRMTLGQFLERWLEDYAQHNVAPRTLERYAGIVHNHLLPALGSVPLGRLRPQHIQGYYSEALRGGRADKRPGGLSARTVLHHHRVLREALQHAVRWQVVARNPADAVEPPRPSRTEMHFLGPDQVHRLLSGCKDSDLYDPVFVALATGLRLGELLALRWAGVDLDVGSLHVTRSLQYLSRRGLVFAEPKTGRSRRRVALSQETVAVLGGHRRRQLESRLALGPAYDDLDLVFPDVLGQPVAPYKLSHRFARLARATGLAPLRFHDLRHTSATLLLQAGVHPKVVSERLGHSGVSITLDTYSHVLPGLQEEAANLLDGYLTGGARQQR